MFYFQHHFPLPFSVLVRFPQGFYLITAQGAKRLLCSTYVCLNMMNTCLIWKESTETLTCSWVHFHYTADCRMHKNYSRFVQQKQKVHLTHRERGEEGGRERDRTAKLFRMANLKSSGKQWLDSLTQFILAKASKRNVSPPAGRHTRVYIFQTQVQHRFVGQNKHLHTINWISWRTFDRLSTIFFFYLKQQQQHQKNNIRGFMVRFLFYKKRITLQSFGCASEFLQAYGQIL